MNFFELFDQFFQLNDQQPIKPLASKLYMYWLHGFNKARWPALLYRRANQVFADLGCDKGTLATAVSQLEARGLLAYEAGKNGLAGKWHLNYEPAAPAWVGKVKNSPQNPASEVENSPSTATSEGENPSSNSSQTGLGDNSRVENSPPIRNRQDTIVEKDQPTPSARAWVGEAAEEITLAPLPAETAQLVPPVAEPPHAAESRPVVAAELPAALLAEVKALANEMGKMWGFSEMNGFPGWSRLYTFAKHQAQHGQLAELRKQLAGYQAGHMRPGVRAHRLADWLGDPEHPDGSYTNGVWCSCTWADIAAQVQARPGQELQSSRATTSRRQAQPQEW